MIDLLINNKIHPVQWIRFSDGTLNCEIAPLPDEVLYKVVICVPSDKEDHSNDLGEVGALLSALALMLTPKQELALSFKGITLNIDYLPNARCDRVFNHGNAPMLDNLLSELEGLDIDELIIADVHNEQALAFENGGTGIPFTNIPQLSCYQQASKRTGNRGKEKPQYDIVVAPDKGAKGKATTISEFLNVPIVYASKSRDLTTGVIKGFSVPEGTDFTGKRVLIPDDILDGGGTFIGLASELKGRGAASVDIYVTHLIAAKGLKIFEKYIDNILFYDIVCRYVTKDAVFNFNNRLRRY